MTNQSLIIRLIRPADGQNAHLLKVFNDSIGQRIINLKRVYETLASSIKRFFIKEPLSERLI